MPFFSIVVPTYNRSHLISKTLESILAQTFQDFEIIIVDDGSTDDTEKVVQAYLSERVHYYKKENEERAVARNFGTKKAIGEYICWFDSDDIMMNFHLEHAQAFIKEKQYPSCIALSHILSDPQLQIKQKVILPQHIEHVLHKGNILSCNAVFLKRAIAVQHPFCPIRTLSVSEDYELWLRIASQYKIYTSPLPTSYIILHDERSVNTMKNAEKLITRFETFLHLIEANPTVVKFLGKNYPFFKMKNYLILSADLAAFGFKKESFYYVKKAISSSLAAFRNRSFWATLKHLIF